MRVKQDISQWLLYRARKMINSIAFYPALIALIFLLLSYLMIHLDDSSLGKDLKANASWLKLKDASTARTVISVIAAGILSLTVFSFTMVMVILNQAASQMSNRVLDKLIGNRLQQVILGTYIGTIVYSLFLLTSIRDSDSGIYVPSISTYLLISFAVIDIFFFIYFLHYITQSIKYAVIIRRIYKQTQHELKENCTLTEEPEFDNFPGGIPLPAPTGGIYNGLNKQGLLNALEKNKCRATLIYPETTYVIKGMPVILVHCPKDQVDDELAQEILETLFINDLQNIDTSYYYGFRQLTEVAIKALSPGINDPGTAVESLRALSSLLSYRLNHHPPRLLSDENGNIRIIKKEYSFEELFHFTILPIWEYGKNDLFIQTELLHLLQQLQLQQHHPSINRLIQKVQQQQTHSRNS